MERAGVPLPAGPRSVGPGPRTWRGHLALVLQSCHAGKMPARRKAGTASPQHRHRCTAGC